MNFSTEGRAPLPKELGKNEGHGHVFKRPDGILARCGGPALCVECAKDLAVLHESHREMHGDCMLCQGKQPAHPQNAARFQDPPPVSTEQVMYALSNCVAALAPLATEHRHWIVHYLDRLTKGAL